MKTMAIIPARKNSKRLPGKNTRLLAGFPLFEWTISQAVATREFKRIVVTTDDNFIIKKSKNYPVNIIQRKNELCLDEVPMEKVIDDVLDKYTDCDNIMLLQVTSPLRELTDIKTVISNYDPTINSIISYDKRTDKINGAIYYTSIDNYKKYGLYYNVKKYKMNHTNSVDIDTIDDFIKAQRGM